MNAQAALAGSFFLLMSFISTFVSAGEPYRTAEQWLEQMQIASVQENYRGVFVFTRGDMASSMRIVHRYKDGEEQERLTQLDGERGEVVRRGSEVMCVLPDNRVVRVEPSKFSNKIVQAFADFKFGHEYYGLELTGHDRQVDRSSAKIVVKAKDQHRYSYVLWLDKQTGLLLKSTLQSAKGAELERFQYTQIEFPAVISDSELTVMNEGDLVKHDVLPVTQKDQNWPVEMMWIADWAPPGFSRISGPDPAGENTIVFSDGLATYSVFIEKSESEMMPEGASLVGATVAYAQKLEFDGHRYNVTVMGEIPAMTAMLVAESIKPEKQ